MEIRIPKFGMSTVEVEIIQVFVAPGQTVRIGDPIAEIETDKSMTTIESEVEGTVTTVLAEAGATCEVGDVLCRLE